MPRISYIVIATLPSEAIATDYIAWLKDGHVDAVRAGGATVGEVVRLESEHAEVPPRIMTRYEFPSRGAFDRYLHDTAPSLRADGMAKFGMAGGVNFQRLVGEIV